MARELIDFVIKGERLRGRLEKVDFIFDEQAGQETEIRRIWEHLKLFSPAPIRRRLGVIPQWYNDVDVLPLQAADMLAWLARKIGVEKLGTDAEVLVNAVDNIAHRGVPIHCFGLIPPLIKSHLTDEFQKEGRAYETGKMRSKRYRTPPGTRGEP